MSEVEIINIIADNVRSLLDDYKMTASELAELSNTSNASISRLLNKNSLPTFRTIFNIAYALEVTIDDIAPQIDLIE